jgi:outer membrane protein assembly factor BamC
MNKDSMKQKMKMMGWLALAALAGCGTVERSGYEADAAKVAALEVPPDMVLPRSDDRYTVPDGSTSSATNYSDYARANAKSADQNATCSCKDATLAAASTPPPVAPVTPPKMQSAPDGSKRISISEPFDRCWLKVSQALDSARIVVEDRDRSKGQFFLKGGKNQILVKATAASCEVSANDNSDDNKRTLDALYKQLGK